MLVERSHGILITAASLMIELCRTEPETINAFKRVCLIIFIFYFIIL